MTKKISTEAYKGTRDFYPRDMAIQRYIFDTWAYTAESFGFERYDASILEPSELYKSKGAENEELVNEQTYTFTDRGDREVTLRPEMTPTVARMVAQRGRLREHWQFNCDMFGIDDVSADIEMILLAYNVLVAFGARESDFEIRINDRALMEFWYTHTFNLSPDDIQKVTRIVDRKNKMSVSDFKKAITEIVSDGENLCRGLEAKNPADLNVDTALTKVIEGLSALGITNVLFDASIARGFSYYTGTIFEIFDTSPDNNRALLGGGRYDNLTSLFEGEAISGIGFGMGDVTMRDFLETHALLPEMVGVTAPELMVLPMSPAQNLECQKIAQSFRAVGISTAVDISDKKIGKKLSVASEVRVGYIIVVGENEINEQKFVLKELSTKSETIGSIDELVKHLS